MNVVPGDPTTPDIVEKQIRFALAQLRAENGHHQFEVICRHFAQARISRNVVPATGPVAAGGDQGRDFETFSSYVVEAPQGSFVAHDEDGVLVFICTLQARGLVRKIKEDVAKAVACGPVGGLYVFCESDLPVGRQHELEQWARVTYRVRLTVINGHRLSAQLAAPDLRWIAQRFLALPVRQDDAGADLRRYLEAAERAAQVHPYALGSRPARVPALTILYQQPSVIDLTAGAGESKDGLRLSEPVAVTIVDLVQRYGHLLLLGGPGAGKSSLFRHVAATMIAGRIEDGAASFIPVCVHARELSYGEPLAEAICDGAVKALGAKLTVRLPPSLFDSEPEPGVPWLVLVDGLDELHNLTRRRQAVDTIMDGLDVPFLRFVIASRPLPDAELDEIRSYCGEVQLGPFDTMTVLRYAEHRFAQQRLPEPHRLAALVASHADAMGDTKLAGTPLVAAMLCTLLSDDPRRALPSNRALLYREYVELVERTPDMTSTPQDRELQESGLAILAAVAHRRQFHDDPVPILHAAMDELADRGLESPLHHGGWRQKVYDTLFRTGLVVPATDGELVFEHQSLEEYLAACYQAQLLLDSDQEVRERAIDELRGGLIHFPDLLSLFGAVWTANGQDLDRLIGELLADEPPGTAEVINGLLNEELPLGAEAVKVLTSMATQWHRESRERLVAARTLRRLDPDAGTALMLALSIDGDMDDRDCLAAVRRLHQAGGVGAVAVRWLMRYDDRMYLLPYRMELVELFMDAERDAKTDVAGLRLILANQYLSDSVRAWAGSVLLNEGWSDGYAQQKAAIPVERLVDALGDLLERGHFEAAVTLRRLAEDPELPDRDRANAEEALELYGEDC